MAACGAQICDEEKIDKPKRLFNYKPTGIKSPEYISIPEVKSESVEEHVDQARKTMDKIMEPIAKIPFFIDAMEKTVNTELVVKKGKISDGDITVYMHRPKNLPKERCAAMIFVHGGGAIAGQGRHFIPVGALMATQYGVVAFTVDYRLAPENGNKGGTDVYAALKYVYDNAEKLGIDKTRIGIEGQSAGAHHTLNACNLMVQNEEIGMCKMILTEVGMFTSVLRFTAEKDWKNEELIFGPQLDLHYKCLFGEEYKKYIENKDEMTFPELVDEDKLKLYPPVAIFSAEFCPLHKGNMKFSQRLEKVGKLLEFRLIRGLGHMYASAQNNETMAVFKDRITCVDTYLKN